MANYQKYMFDDFIVEDENTKSVFVDDDEVSSVIVSDEVFEIEDVEDNNVIKEEKDDNEIESFVEPEIQNRENFVQQEQKEELSDFQPYNYVKEIEPVENLITYTEEEMKEALAQAEEVAYNKGIAEAKSSMDEKQNILLEDIKNQLMAIFASLDEKKSDIEISALNFAVSLVEKIMPTIERDRAEKEVKNFLAENFANFSSQESLSFSFNPDMLSHVSDSIRRLAEQNDFEGKISVHKDISLGLSDCRVEWKSGGVERKTSSVMDKVKNLIKIGNQERENG